jgi:hypothetical protein
VVEAALTRFSDKRRVMNGRMVGRSHNFSTPWAFDLADPLRREPGQNRWNTLRPNPMTLRPNIMNAPAAAATADTTGIIVSGPI